MALELFKKSIISWNKYYLGTIPKTIIATKLGETNENIILNT